MKKGIAILLILLLAFGFVAIVVGVSGCGFIDGQAGSCVGESGCSGYTNKKACEANDSCCWKSFYK
ncbi:hypothetical protein KY332_04635 [Candidatus Woesearchaeota archaeon]|nr:hypothetical protein [Candidatus Woesearchaeota archaeon]